MSSFRNFPDIDVYTSCPLDTSHARDVSLWSDRFGCRGMLLYTDNKCPDPWVLGQDIITHTTDLSPLIAVQPIYMHPYATAQKVAALSGLYERPIDLNLVAGGFQTDLAALDDKLEHDARYDRLTEYGMIVMKLLAGERLTFKGAHYNVYGLQLRNRLSPNLLPRVTVAGSSPSGRKCASVLGATAVTYPEPLNSRPISREVESAGTDLALQRTGIRLGILARSTSEAAWTEANRWLPATAQDSSRLKSVVAVTDSSWLRQLANVAVDPEAPHSSTYWIAPFESGISFCPYLVGSYEEVAAYLAGYLGSGVKVIILDTPREIYDLEHAYIAISMSLTGISSPETHCS
jgi:alkanesulfonate monooxygenase